MIVEFFYSFLGDVVYWIFWDEKTMQLLKVRNANYTPMWYLYGIAVEHHDKGTFAYCCFVDFRVMFCNLLPKLSCWGAAVHCVQHLLVNGTFTHFKRWSWRLIFFYSRAIPERCAVGSGGLHIRSHPRFQPVHGIEWMEQDVRSILHRPRNVPEQFRHAPTLRYRHLPRGWIRLLPN